MPRKESKSLCHRQDLFTIAFAHGITATFTAGAAPQHVEFARNVDSMLQVETVENGLQVSWYQPTRNVWVEFVSEPQARRACHGLNGKVLRGVKLSAEAKTSLTGKRWTVHVSNVVDGVERDDLLKRLPARVPTPRKVTFADLLYDPLISIMDVIKEKIGELTDRRIIRDEFISSPNQLKRKILISFRGSPNLSGLAKELDGMPFEKLGNSKVWAAEQMVVVIKLKRTVYARHAPKMKETAGRIARECHVRVSFENTRKPERSEDFDKVPVYLKLIGNDRDSVKHAKAIIEELVTEHRQAKIVHQQQPVKQDHRIRLTKTKDYLSAVNGRFADVEAVLGKDVVKLDAASDPSAIVVKGNGDAVREAEQILHESTSEEPTDCSTCPICADDDTSDVVRVAPCGHTACKDCFVQYCMTPRESRFPLQCFVCDKLIPINQLRTNLSKTDFNSLLHQSLNNYFEGIYARCPGPNCDIYCSVTDAGDLHICPGCLTSVCTKCNIEYHFGETCAEYKDRMSGYVLAMERTLAQMGAKRCIKCNTPIQKDTGCDHMQCPGCHTHFCWVCLETFETQGETYKHMSNSHHTWFVAEDERLREVANRPREGHAGDVPDLDLADVQRLVHQIQMMELRGFDEWVDDEPPPPPPARRHRERRGILHEDGD